MDIRDLFLNCRSGDLKKIKYLVEAKDVDLNVRDRWDSTPLYYACLCGHGELVEYMLENGARCEAQTFDGERAIYGALTNEIRNKLKNFKVVTSRVVTRDDYEEFLRKMLDLGEYSDFTFNICNQIIPVHRFILAARSPYFYEAFQTRWSSRKSTKLQNSLVDPSAFKTLIQYLYTGRLNTPIDEVEECIRLAVQCRLPDLRERLEEANKRLASFANTKPGTKIKVLTLESAQLQAELQRDLGHLANLAIPPELRMNHRTEMPALAHLVDVCFVVEHHKFYCHKAAFAVRSEYFRALFRDHFGETSQTDILNDSADELSSPPAVDVLSIREITAAVFAQVVLYVYSNSIEISADTVYELLNVGELYLMPGLKKLCANHLISMIDVENVVDLIRMSRTYQLPRLETFCTEFIAKHLAEMWDQEDFHQLILEDAAEVKGRQETDTIGIIDDVRYHINFLFQDSSALEKHRLIEQLLESLNLEA